MENDSTPYPAITIVSAHPLSHKARNALRYSYPDGEITERVDSRLIGGAIIRVGDKRLDGSIAGSLRRLKATLLYDE